MTDPVDTSAEAVRLLLDELKSAAESQKDDYPFTSFDSFHVAEAIVRALLARAEAAESKLSEASAYRMAASAFIASRGLLGEFDAWCERGHLPPDAAGRLVAVARAAERERRGDLDGRSTADSRMRNRQALDDALDALLDVAPGALDQSDG